MSDSNTENWRLQSDLRRVMALSDRATNSKGDGR